MDGLDPIRHSTMPGTSEGLPDIDSKGVSGSDAAIMRRSRSLQGAITIGGLVWIAAFVTLLQLLPLRPDRAIPDAQDLIVTGWHDETHLDVETIPDEILSSPGAPLRIDLEKGTTADRTLPDESATARAAAKRFAQVDGWTVSSVVRTGDRATAILVDDRRNLRLLLLDAVTGDELSRRDFLECESGRLGNHLWVESVWPSLPGSFVHLINLATGRDVPSRLVDQGLRFSQCRPSTDNRFVSIQSQGRVWVWNIEPGNEVISVDAEQFAFSADSRFAATLSVSGNGSSAALSETWRTYDLATGAVVAEAEAPPPNGRPPIAQFTFFDEDRCLACGHTPRSNEYSEIDLWRWQAEEPLAQSDATSPSISASIAESGIQTLRPESEGFRPPQNWYTDRTDSVPTVLVDGLALIETATGRTVGTLPHGYELSNLSRGRRWAILQSTSAPLLERISGQVAPFSPLIASWLPEGRRGRLYDVAAGRMIASFGMEETGSATFSPSDNRLATHDRTTIRMWTLPPSIPGREAFAWSLLAPAALAAHQLWTAARKRPR